MNCESRQHLQPFENLFNVFYQDFSRQTETCEPCVAVFTRTVSTRLIVDHVDQSLKFQKNTYCVLNRLLLPGMQLQICN